MKVKVLVHNHGADFVDHSLLHKGIYLTLIPSIYPEHETIESLLAQYENIPSMLFSSLSTFVQNFKQCKLVEYDLTPAKQMDIERLEYALKLADDIASSDKEFVERSIIPELEKELKDLQESK